VLRVAVQLSDRLTCRESFPKVFMKRLNLLNLDLNLLVALDALVE
jgi:hypothetical protein